MFKLCSRTLKQALKMAAFYNLKWKRENFSRQQRWKHNFYWGKNDLFYIILCQKIAIFVEDYKIRMHVYIASRNCEFTFFTWKS